MNSQSKSVFDGTTQITTSHAYNFRAPSSSASSSFSASKSVQLTRHILRCTAMVLAFIASIVIGTGKNRARVAILDPTSSTPIIFVESIKAKYSSALVYFIVVNVLVFVYSASSLAESVLNKVSSRNLGLAFKIADLLFLVLLFSSNGAAAATSVAIENGNVQLGWIKICHAASDFCTHVTASIVLSMFAAVAYFAIVLLDMIGTHYFD